MEIKDYKAVFVGIIKQNDDERKVLEYLEELEYLAIRLCYPEKFWKIINSYYHSNKAWVSEKSVEKLRICIGQVEEKQLFLENILSFHLG